MSLADPAMCVAPESLDPMTVPASMTSEPTYPMSLPEGEGGGGTAAGGPGGEGGGAHHPGQGGGSAAARMRAQRQAEALEDAALATPFVPQAVPQREAGARRLSPYLMSLEAEAPPFAVDRGLGIAPAEGVKELPPYLQNYEIHFRDAVGAAQRTYDDVIAARAEQARELSMAQQRATAQAQRALDDGLDLLDRALDRERGALEQGEREAIFRLELIADTARMMVRQAAAGALATVAARKRVIEGRIAEAGLARDDIAAQLDWFLTEVDSAGPPAAEAFTGLATDPSPAHFPNAREPASEFAPQMESAMNEDLDPAVAHHANERSTAYTNAQRIFGANLDTAHTNFLNSATSAFAPFQAYIDMLGGPAPRQIRSLRDQALKSIDRMEKRTRRSILENRNKADIQFIESHRQSRRRFADQVQAAATGANRAIHKAGLSQLRGFATLAGAQQSTVKALRERIEDQAGQSAEPFARYVIEASRRTAQRGETLAGGRLAQAVGRGRGMRTEIVGKALTAAETHRQLSRQFAQQFAQLTIQTSAQLMDAALAQEFALRKQAEPVAKSVDSFRIPAQAELDAMENTLWQRLGQARQQAEAAYYGGEAPASVEPEPAASTTEQPPPGTGSKPAEFVSLADERALAPQDEPRVTTVADRIGQTVRTDVERRGNGLMPQMTITGQNPQETLALVRGLTYLRGQAVIKYYDVRTGSSLWDDVPFYMSFGNLLTGITTRVESGRAVQNYLMGNRAAGALHEVQAATEFWNDPDQAMAAMSELSPADMAALRALDPDGRVLNAVAEDLGGNQGRAFNILRNATAENAQESMAAARAVRLGEKIEDDLGSDPERGADNAFDSMEAVARQVGTSRLEGANEYGLDANFEVESPEAREARTRAAWRDTVSRLGGTGEVREGGVEGGLAWLDETVSRRRTYWAVDFNPAGLIVPGMPLAELRVWDANIRPEQRRLLHNLAEFGAGDPRTRAAQLTVEDTRAGGAKRERFEHAYYDARSNADMANPDDPEARTSHPPRPGDPPTDLQRAQADEEAMLRYYDEYRNGRPHDNPRPVEEIRNDLGASLRAGASDERLGRLLEMQVTRGLTDPKTAALAFEHAVDRWGTDERLLRDTFGRMTRDQIEAAVAEYDRTHNPGLYERLGLFNHENDWFTELSGDDRLEIQVLAMGQPRNDRERAEVSRMTSRLQKNNASWLSQHVLARGEYNRMAASHDRLLNAMGATDADFDAFGRLRTRAGVPIGNWDERGNFRPTGEVGRIAFAAEMASNEAHAANFRTVTDNIANAVSMAIIIAAAVISTIATGGTAASIWIPALVTLGGGVVAMGANYLIKGGRYGYEDMGRDFGMAVVQAATAGMASALTIGATGGMTALRLAATSRMISNVGFRSATLLEEAAIAGVAGAFGNAGNAMFDDQAWDSGEWLDGIGRGFERGAGGGFLGGFATGMVTRGVGGVAGRIAQSRGAREAAARGLTGAEAQAVAAARSRAAQQAFGTTLTGRTVGGGIGGAATRAYEIQYDRAQGRYRGGSAMAWDEIVGAGMQNAGQSFAEGLGEHAFKGDARLEAWQQRLIERATGIRDAPSPHVTAPHEATPEGPRVLRTEDAPPPGEIVIRPANDNGPPAHLRAALSDTNLAAMPRLAEGSVVVHPDSRNLMAANDNFGRLVNLSPDREVAIHFNPVTGEYVVIQGGATTVATILPGGEIKTASGSRLVTQGGVPQPGGYWIVHAHYHPNRPGHEGTAFIRRLPSGFAGDFGVLHFESVGLRLGDRSSRIYYNDAGHVAFTDFGITSGHPKGDYWIDYPDPVTSERVRRHFDSPAAYGDFLKGVAGDPSRAAQGGVRGEPGPLRTADHQEPPPSRARADGPPDRASVQALVEQIASVSEHRRVLAVLAERGASESLMTAVRSWLSDVEASAESMVHGLGLVDEPQSHARLRQLMNDTTLEPALRQAIADQVLEATRRRMVATGRVGPDEALMLLFHGAPIGRARSIANEGINMARIGGGRDDDFGRGLYLTSGIDNAERYASKFGAERGEILPFFLSRRQLGVVVDVRPGGAHRAEWEAFVTANLHKFDEANRMNPRYVEALMAGRQPAFAHMDAFGNRGGVFDAFRRHLAERMGNPVLAEPDIVLGELGGPFTTGVGWGDQQAVRTAHIADELNRQLGREPLPLEPPMLRTEDELPAPARARAREDEAPTPAARSARDARDLSPELRRLTDERRALAARSDADPAAISALDRQIGAELTRLRALTAPPATTPLPLETRLRMGARDIDRAEYREAARARRLAARLEALEAGGPHRALPREAYEEAAQARRVSEREAAIDDLGLDLMDTGPPPEPLAPQQGPAPDPDALRQAELDRVVGEMRAQRGDADADRLQRLLALGGPAAERMLLAESEGGLARARAAFEATLRASGMPPADIVRALADMDDLAFRRAGGATYGYGTERRRTMRAEEEAILDQRIAASQLPADTPRAAQLRAILADSTSDTSFIARRLHASTAVDGSSDAVAQWRAYVAGLPRGQRPSAAGFDAYLRAYMSSTQRPRLSEVTAAHMLAKPPPPGSFIVNPSQARRFADMGVELLKTAIDVDPVTGASRNQPWEPGSDILGYRRSDDHVVYGDDKAWRRTDRNRGLIEDVSALTTSLADNMIADAAALQAAMGRATARGLPVDPAHAGIPQRLLDCARDIQAAFPNGYRAADGGAERLAAILQRHRIAMVVTSAADRGIIGLSGPLVRAGLLFVISAPPANERRQP